MRAGTVKDDAELLIAIQMRVDGHTVSQISAHMPHKTANQWGSATYAVMSADVSYSDERGVRARYW